MMDRGRSSANSMAQFFGQLRAAIDQRQQSASAYGDRMMGYGSYGTQQMSGAASYSGLGSHSTSAVSSLGLRPGYAEATSLGYIRGDESSWQEPRRRSLPDRSELLTSSLPHESMLDDISYRRDRLDESRYGRYERDVGYGVDSRVSVGLRSSLDPEPPVMSNSARLGRMLEAVGVHDEVALRNLISTAVQNQAAPSRPPQSLTEDELYDAAYGKERHRHTRRDNTERSRSQEQRHRSREDVDRRRSHGGARSRSPISRSRDREPQRKSSVGRTSSSRTGVHQSSGKGGSSQRDVNTLSLEELQVVQQVAEQFGIDDMSIALEALKFVKQLGNTSAEELKLFADLVRGMNEGRLSLSQVATKLPRHLAEVVVKGNIRPALLQMIIDSTADPGSATDRRNRSRSRRGKDRSPSRTGRAETGKRSKKEQIVTVVVKNLQMGTQKEDVRKIFRENKISVTDIRLRFIARGQYLWGFVDLANPNDLERALKLHGKNFHGTLLNLEKAAALRKTEGQRKNSPSPPRKESRKETPSLSRRERAASGKTKGHNPCKLHVGKIPVDCTKGDLKTAFPRALNIEIPTARRSGCNRGYAFVQLATEEEVRQAVERQGIYIRGQAVTLHHSVATRSRDTDSKDSAGGKGTTLIVKNLPKDMTEETLEKVFEGCKEARKTLGLMYGFVEYHSVEAAQEVCNTMSGKEVNGRKVRVDFARPLGKLPEPEKSNVLFVKNLAEATTEETLRVAFDGCTDARVILDPATGKHKGYGFVEFSSKEAAQEAYETLSDLIVDGSKVTLAYDIGVKRSPSKSRPRGRGQLGVKADRSKVGIRIAQALVRSARARVRVRGKKPRGKGTLAGRAKKGASAKKGRSK